MSGYGIDPEPVYNAGKNIHGLGVEAWIKADGLINGSMREVAGIVGHPLVEGAVNRFCDDHAHVPAALQNALEWVGGNTAGTATDSVDAENEMTATHSSVTMQGEGFLSSLDRVV